MASWYETAWFCERCLGRLTYAQKMGSHGTVVVRRIEGEPRREGVPVTVQVLEPRKLPPS